MADYQGPYSGAQVDAALKAATELQPKVTEIDDKLTELADDLTLQGTKTSLNEAKICHLKESKADKEGYYSSLVAGAAENLINTSGDGVVRELTYDTAGGTADIGTGTAIIKRMRGKSLVWNQIFEPLSSSIGTNVVNGVTFTLTAEGMVTAEGTAEGASAVLTLGSILLVAGHKYLLIANGAPNGLWGASGLYFSGETGLNDKSMVKNGYSIFTPTGKVSVVLVLSVWANNSISCSFTPRLFDLTQMFGAGNEPATIEEFKGLFPRDDYAYNKGEVIHFNGRRLLTTGFNQWDEQWELGRIDTTNGNVSEIYDSIRSKNFTKVFPNTKYYGCGKSKMLIFYYDEQFNFVDWWGIDPYRELTMPANVRYVKFMRQNVTTYDNDFCFNLSWSGYRNGEYEPYEEHILELPYGVYGDGLKSAGTAYDEVTEERYVKRIGVVDMGTLNWIGSSAEGYENSFWAKGQLADKAAGSNLTTIYSITNANGWIIASNADKAICGSTTAGYEKDIWVRDSAYTDAESFKAAMSGVMLYYELAEPIVTEFETPLNLGYYVNDFGTEMILPENGIAPFTAPAVFDILYAMNAVDTLRNLPTNYISKESFDNFSAALSSALANAGITMSIKTTFDEESGTYHYTITASKTE